MGKTDNIKRAKRLKEAKRKREQEALRAAGINPAQQALQKRTASGENLVITNTGSVKYSDLLTEFVYPILLPTDNLDFIKKKYAFGICAWNAAVTRQKSEKQYQLVKKDFIALMPDEPAITELFEDMVNRKQKEFANYKNTFFDFEIRRGRGDNIDISVMTNPPLDG